MKAMFLALTMMLLVQVRTRSQIRNPALSDVKEHQENHKTIFYKNLEQYQHAPSLLENKIEVQDSSLRITNGKHIYQLI